MKPTQASQAALWEARYSNKRIGRRHLLIGGVTFLLLVAMVIALIVGGVRIGGESRAIKLARNELMLDITDMAANSKAPELASLAVHGTRIIQSREVSQEDGLRRIEIRMDIPLVDRGEYTPAPYGGSDPMGYLEGVRDGCYQAVRANFLEASESASYTVHAMVDGEDCWFEEAELANIVNRIPADMETTMQRVWRESDMDIAIADLLLPAPGGENGAAFAAAIAAIVPQAQADEGDLAPLLAGVRDIEAVTDGGTRTLRFESLSLDAAMERSIGTVYAAISQNLLAGLPDEQSIEERFRAAMMEEARSFADGDSMGEVREYAYDLEGIMARGVAGSEACVARVTQYLEGYQAAIDKLNERVATLPTLAPKDQPKTGLLHGESEGRRVTVSTQDGTGAHHLKFISGGKVVVSMFVREGDELRTRLPVGDYQVLIGAGEAWYGDQYSFYTGGTYRELVIRIEKGKSYDLMLDAQDSNMTGIDIPFEKFRG